MSLNYLLRREQKGEILKAERILVRLERIDNPHAHIPSEFTEQSKVDRRLKREWKEYYVVARAPHDQVKHVVLHIHKNRRIPATLKSHTGKTSRWEVHLDPSNTRVSLFSPLDKTIAIIQPKRNKGYILFILNCQSVPSSMQWYAFVRHCLNGPPRDKMLTITVPDLDYLQIRVNTYREGAGEHGQVMFNGHPISANDIIQRCMTELRKENRYTDVIDYWERNYGMGLCWKRYDRIEWLEGITDPNTDELAGSFSLTKTHNLELRPKTHYPTRIRLGFEKYLEEPAPVEGFLVRLTAASGRQARFGKLFYKRLYFTSNDYLLFYCSPGKAAPPPPPKMSKMPTEKDKDKDKNKTKDEIPLIWATAPYKLKEGKIRWLEESKSPEQTQWYDSKAKMEYERCVQLVKNTDGFIDLSKVKYVRTVRRKPEGQDAGIGQGESVDFHAAQLSTNDPEYAFEQGTASEFDDERTFELVLENGLVIRLQCFSLETRKEWMRRLRDLIKYWKLRLAEEINTLKEMREENLKILGVDRGNEAQYADYIQKYQLVEAISAPGLYHFCKISHCRPISMRGFLFAKFRRHQTFEPFMAILTASTLIIHEHTARSLRGISQPRIHHKKIKSIDLRHCYVYSGPMVDDELMYQTTMLDPHLGYRVLPKLYKDGWTSTDDDLSCSFVLWHGMRKFTFRKQIAQAARGGEKYHIANVGLPGKIVVFMARSRPERDMWVSALGYEINHHASTVGETLDVY